MKVNDIVKLKTGEIAKILFIGLNSAKVSYFNLEYAENGYFDIDEWLIRVDDIENFVIASIFCENCKRQECITGTFAQHDFCDKYEVKLQNEKMTSMAESVRCMKCLRDGESYE